MKLCQSELAEKLSVNIRTIINWRRKGLPFTKNKDGGVMFCMKKVDAWLDARKEKSKYCEQFNKAKTRLEFYKAKIARLEYEEKIKEYVLAADVEKAREKFSLRLRNSLLKVPDKIVEALDELTSDKRCDPKEVRNILMEEFKAALESL